MVKRWRGPETLTMIGEVNDSYNNGHIDSTACPVPFSRTPRKGGSFISQGTESYSIFRCLTQESKFPSPVSKDSLFQGKGYFHIQL